MKNARLNLNIFDKNDNNYVGKTNVLVRPDEVNRRIHWYMTKRMKKTMTVSIDGVNVTYVNLWMWSKIPEKNKFGDFVGSLDEYENDFFFIVNDAKGIPVIVKDVGRMFIDSDFLMTDNDGKVKILEKTGVKVKCGRDTRRYNPAWDGMARFISKTAGISIDEASRISPWYEIRRYQNDEISVKHRILHFERVPMRGPRTEDEMLDRLIANEMNDYGD